MQWIGLIGETFPFVVDEIENDAEIRAFVVAGRGKSFSTGLDLTQFFSDFKEKIHGSTADEREELYKLILTMQKGIDRIQYSHKPSIAAIQKHCIGGGLDLIASCDIRYATKDASISLREAKVRWRRRYGFIKSIAFYHSQGHTRELALTGENVSGGRTLTMGLVTKLFNTVEELMEGAKSTAREIAENPAIVIRGVGGPELLYG